MNKFGTALKDLMDRDRVSVSQLAKIVGEPMKTVQEWVGANGRTPRNLEVIPKLASFFKVSTHRLLFGQEDPHHALTSILERTELHIGLYEVSIKRVKEKEDK